MIAGDSVKPELKDFYNTQYRWIRLQRPSLSPTVNRSHPLYPVELQISHQEYFVHSLIKDILSGGGLFGREDVDRLAQVFRDADAQLQELQGVPGAAEYKRYVDATLELLAQAQKLVRG